MSSLNGNGAAPNGGTTHSNLTPPNFDAGAVVTFWQSSAARLMRSKEVFMRGMAEVARLEVELGQRLLQRGMVGLRMPASGEAAQDRARVQLNHATQEFESLVASMRKIGDEARGAYRDATLALFDAALPPAQQFPPAAADIDGLLVKPKPAPLAATPVRAAAAE